MTTRSVGLLAIAVLLAFVLRESREAASGSVRVVLAPRTGREAAVLAELAATPESRARGLGVRTSLPENGGMLFIYSSDQQHSFWMKDCLIGLDIAFIGPDRRVVNVVSLPSAYGLPDQAVPHAYPTGPFRYVLETNMGWFAAHRLGSGDEIEFLASVDPASPR